MTTTPNMDPVLSTLLKVRKHMEDPENFHVKTFVHPFKQEKVCVRGAINYVLTGAGGAPTGELASRVDEFIGGNDAADINNNQGHKAVLELLDRKIEERTSMLEEVV